MTGVVCEADAACGEPTRSRSLNRFANDPEPNPHSGLSASILSPPRISFSRPPEERWTA